MDPPSSIFKTSNDIQFIISDLKNIKVCIISSIVAKVIYWRYEICGFFRHEALLASLILANFSVISTRRVKDDVTRGTDGKFRRKNFNQDASIYPRRKKRGKQPNPTCIAMRHDKIISSTQIHAVAFSFLSRKPT